MRLLPPAHRVASVVAGAMSALFSLSVPSAAQSPFASCAHATGRDATVLVSSAEVGGQPLAPGDVVAAFGPQGRCVGTATWRSGPAVLTVWGDDAATPEQEGLVPGDSIEFRIWNAAEGVVYAGEAVLVEYDPAFTGGSRYERDAVFVLTSLRASASTTATEDAAAYPSGLFPPLPNPARSTVRIPYALAVPAEVRLEVYDALGRRVSSLHFGHDAAGRYERPLDTSGFAPGAYVLRATILPGNGRPTDFVQRLVIVR